MAGLSGKSAWFASAKQTVKGTAATTPVYKNAFSGGNLNPARNTDRLSETDSARDQGAAYVQSVRAEGSPELYVRDKTLPFFLAGAMGNVVTTGTTPNYVHTITPGNALAYHTFWKNVGGPTGLFEQYSDCIIGSISVSAEAGSPLSATVGIQGLVSERLAADPDVAVLLNSDPVYNFNNAAVTLGGSVTRLVRSFEFTLENNIDTQQTDDVQPYDISIGQREISLGFDMLFEDLTEYNKFHYGGASGTQISPNIYTTSAAFTFTLGTNNEVTFTFPSIAYEEFPIEPDPGGDPIVVSARAVGQKATGVTNLVTAVVKNQVASY